MTPENFDRSIWVWSITLVTLVFGVLTIYSGGAVLFIDGSAREDAGNYVPFVLWFNFFAGFIYLLAGLGIFMNKHWAARLSMAIFVATIIVFMLLGLHIINAGPYEARTIGAMSLRSMVWASISLYAYRTILRH